MWVISFGLARWLFSHSSWDSFSYQLFFPLSELWGLCILLSLSCQNNNTELRSDFYIWMCSSNNWVLFSLLIPQVWYKRFYQALYNDALLNSKMFFLAPVCVTPGDWKVCKVTSLRGSFSMGCSRSPQFGCMRTDMCCFPRQAPSCSCEPLTLSSPRELFPVELLNHWSKWNRVDLQNGNGHLGCVKGAFQLQLSSQGSKAKRGTHCPGWLKNKGLLNEFCLSSLYYLMSSLRHDCLCRMINFCKTFPVWLWLLKSMQYLLIWFPGLVRMGNSARTKSPTFTKAVCTFSVMTREHTSCYNWDSFRPLERYCAPLGASGHVEAQPAATERRRGASHSQRLSVQGTCGLPG